MYMYKAYTYCIQMHKDICIHMHAHTYHSSIYIPYSVNRMGWQGSSARKGVCCQVQQSEFSSRDSHEENGEQTHEKLSSDHHMRAMP